MPLLSSDQMGFAIPVWNSVAAQHGDEAIYESAVGVGV
jgi:hypothetical protein